MISSPFLPTSNCPLLVYDFPITILIIYPFSCHYPYRTIFQVHPTPHHPIRSNISSGSGWVPCTRCLPMHPDLYSIQYPISSGRFSCTIRQSHSYNKTSPIFFPALLSRRVSRFLQSCVPWWVQASSRRRCSREVRLYLHQ